MPSKVLSWTHDFVVVRALLADLALIRDLLFALSCLVGFIITYFLLVIWQGLHCRLEGVLSLAGVGIYCRCFVFHPIVFSGPLLHRLVWGGFIILQWAVVIQ